jgi:hypothetical protein
LQMDRRMRSYGQCRRRTDLDGIWFELLPEPANRVQQHSRSRKAMSEEQDFLISNVNLQMASAMRRFRNLQSSEQHHHF